MGFDDLNEQIAEIKHMPRGSVKNKTKHCITLHKKQ